MCVDLSHLNKYIKRERYQCPTPAQAVTDIASDNAQGFTKFDALKDNTNAFWMKRVNLRHSLLRLVGSSTYEHHMAYRYIRTLQPADG